jgi:hypothetical protein
MISMALHSNRKPADSGRVSLWLFLWSKVTGAALMPLLFSLISQPTFSQQTGRKVKPSSSGKIDIQEIEKREKESGRKEAKKPPENQNLKFPLEFPVPKGAKGKTFRPPTPEKKSAVRAAGRTVSGAPVAEGLRDNEEMGSSHQTGLVMCALANPRGLNLSSSSFRAALISPGSDFIGRRIALLARQGSW